MMSDVRDAPAVRTTTNLGDHALAGFTALAARDRKQLGANSEMSRGAVEPSAKGSNARQNGIPLFQEVRDARAAAAADFDLHKFIAWPKSHAAAECKAEHWLPTNPKGNPKISKQRTSHLRPGSAAAFVPGSRLEHTDTSLASWFRACRALLLFQYLHPFDVRPSSQSVDPMGSVFRLRSTRTAWACVLPFALQRITSASALRQLPKPT